MYLVFPFNFPVIMTIICLPTPNFLCTPRFRTERFFFVNGECEVTWYISRHHCMKWLVHILRDKTSIFTSLYLKHLNLCISSNMLLKRTVLCWAIMQRVVLLSISQQKPQIMHAAHTFKSYNSLSYSSCHFQTTAWKVCIGLLDWVPN